MASPLNFKEFARKKMHVVYQPKKQNFTKQLN